MSAAATDWYDDDAVELREHTYEWSLPELSVLTKRLYYS